MSLPQMVTPRTGKPRGRPKLPFPQDPDRFAIALAFALKRLGNSENNAFRAVAAAAFGIKRSAEQIEARRKRGRGAVPTGLKVTYQGASSGTLLSRATSLRQKSARAWRNPECMPWLLYWHEAFLLALQAASSAERCVTRILQLGQMVAAGELAEDRMLNVLSAELPDLFTNDPAQEQA